MARRLDRRLDRAASRHLRFRLGRELRAHRQHGELRQSAVDLLRAALGHQGRFGSHLWVEEYEFPGEERPGSLWTVFGPEGHVLGFVETPPALANAIVISVHSQARLPLARETSATRLHHLS